MAWPTAKPGSRRSMPKRSGACWRMSRGCARPGLKPQSRRHRIPCCGKRPKDAPGPLVATASTRDEAFETKAEEGWEAWRRGLKHRRTPPRTARRARPKSCSSSLAPFLGAADSPEERRRLSRAFDARIAPLAELRRCWCPAADPLLLRGAVRQCGASRPDRGGGLDAGSGASRPGLDLFAGEARIPGAAMESR